MKITKEQDKKGNEYDVCEYTLNDLLPIGMTFVMLSVGLGFGAIVLSDMKADTTDADADAILGNGSSALLKISAKQGILATVAIASVVIGILFTFFMFRR